MKEEDIKKEIEKIDKYNEMLDLFFKIPNLDAICKYFDYESEELLDEKIAVFKRLIAGEKWSDIPNADDILEFLPKSKSGFEWKS